jgi:hypothetical protein
MAEATGKFVDLETAHCRWMAENFLARALRIGKIS